LIQVKGVTKKYGKFLAVDNLNFEINDGEIVGLLGPNGAGKSTTMNILTGLIEATDGTILIDGKDVVKYGKEIKGKIGYMPENVPLYSDLTVKEFITYMCELKHITKKEKKREVQDILEKVNLVDVQNKLIKNLSRGYKQRVSLAGALVGNPRILILDEPTVGMDPKQITEIRELIKSMGKEKTIILSSHILPEVSQICEKIIIINKGKLLAIDTPNNLEKLVQCDNKIVVTVEDKNNKMATLKSKYEYISNIEQIADNNDGTKQYVIYPKDNIDLRKKIFEILPKENITIFELKKSNVSLEDAFLNIINKNAEGGKN